jgi:hypothetical protein
MTHNLDINTYSLEEIMGLLDLDFNLTEESMRRAKKKVLMTHPDKSKLPQEYFLFYKQAYEIVLNIFKQKVRASSASSTVYDPNNIQRNTLGTNSQIELSGSHVKKVSNNKFNELFETNVAKKVDNAKYEWFKNEGADEFSGKNINPKNMGSELEAFKQRQSSMIVYRGVQELQSSNSGTSYFDDEDDTSNDYVSCDIFGKLKFDDLRKVHKDQTVLAVSESNLNQRKQYHSVDQFVRDRDQASNGASMTKQEAENVLERQRKEKERLIMQRQHRDYMLQKEYEDKMNNVRSAFLQLK